VRHAARDDVPDLARAVAAQQAGGNRRALAGRADDGDRLARGHAFGDVAYVVVGDVERSGDGPRVELRALAHVDHLPAALALLPPLVQLLDVDALGALGRQTLLAPARHAAGQDPGHRRDADRPRERGGAARLGVVAAGEDDLLLGLDDPRELRAEAR